MEINRAVLGSDDRRPTAARIMWGDRARVTTHAPEFGGRHESMGLGYRDVGRIWHDARGRWRHASIDEKRPWGSGLMVIGPEAAAQQNARVEAIPGRLPPLSSSGTAETLLFVTGDLAPAKAVGVKGQVRLKLIEVPLSEASIGPDELKSGRLPMPGGNEILAARRSNRARL